MPTLVAETLTMGSPRNGRPMRMTKRMRATWVREAVNPDRPISYVPIDPCQPVIAGLRTALGEHMTALH